ncbi:Conserved_hypothetical protein [Hexamita inflata]|uniref:Ankyrin repeat-containing protein n=1 Tax=Hexamita inflata TaxID=28002 RepID=A0AA86N4Z3_9EUKA|nr:Conserved hypothetical protein [Hexamita inflata]
MCYPTKRTLWFNAAKEDDLEYIIEHADKMTRKRDQRQTDVAKNIFQGFTALHYACLFGNHHLLTFLLRMECDMLTTVENLIPAPGIQDIKLFLLPKGSNFYQIATLSKHPQLVDEIRYMVQADPDFIWCPPISRLYSSLSIASLCIYEDVIDVINTPEMLQKELDLHLSGLLTPIGLACKYGNHYAMKAYLQLCSNIWYRGSIYYMILQKQNGQTVLNLLQEAKCGDREKTKLYFLQILEMAKSDQYYGKFAEQFEGTEDLDIKLEATMQQSPVSKKSLRQLRQKSMKALKQSQKYFKKQPIRNILQEKGIINNESNIGELNLVNQSKLRIIRQELGFNDSLEIQADIIIQGNDSEIINNQVQKESHSIQQ